MTQQENQNLWVSFIHKVKEMINDIRMPKIKLALEKITGLIQPKLSKPEIVDRLIDILEADIYDITISSGKSNKVQKVIDYLQNSFCSKKLGIQFQPEVLKNLFESENFRFPTTRKETNKLITYHKVDNLLQTESQQFVCICPQGDVIFAQTEETSNCYKCKIKFHHKCLFGSDQNEKLQFNQCPSCFLENCVPHKTVEKAIFAGYLRKFQSNKVEYRLNFTIPQKIQQKQFNYQMRSMRINPQVDPHLYNYEITWPDHMTMFHDDEKIAQLKPLHIDSQFSRRFDKQISLNKYIFSDQKKAELIINIKHRDKSHFRYEYASHFVMIFAMKIQSETQLFDKFNKQRISIAQSKQFLKRYLKLDQQSCIKVQRLSIDLKCPLFSTPITTPVRSVHCSTHFQAFDLKNFIDRNKTLKQGSLQKYKCPYCKKRAYDLIVDDYILSLLILRQIRGQNIQITFNADGSLNSIKDTPEKPNLMQKNSKTIQNMDTNQKLPVNPVKLQFQQQVDIKPSQLLFASAIEQNDLKQQDEQYNQMNSYIQSEEEQKLIEQNDIFCQYLNQLALQYDLESNLSFGHDKIPINHQVQNTEVLKQMYEPFINPLQISNNTKPIICINEQSVQIVEDFRIQEQKTNNNDQAIHNKKGVQLIQIYNDSRDMIQLQNDEGEFQNQLKKQQNYVDQKVIQIQQIGPIDNQKNSKLSLFPNVNMVIFPTQNFYINDLNNVLMNLMTEISNLKSQNQSLRKRVVDLETLKQKNTSLSSKNNKSQEKISQCQEQSKLKDKYVWIGYAKYESSKTILNTNRIDLRNPGINKILEIVNSEKWYTSSFCLSKDPTFRSKWILIWTGLIEARCKALDLDQLQNFRFNYIQTPFYNCLRKISLRNLKITSIQSLTFISMPVLKVLDINQNHISKLNSFNKLHLPYLKYITLSNNEFNQIQDIHKMLTSKCLRLDWIYCWDNCKELRDFRFQIKLFAERFGADRRDIKSTLYYKRRSRNPGRNSFVREDEKCPDNPSDSDEDEAISIS